LKVHTHQMSDTSPAINGYYIIVKEEAGFVLKAFWGTSEQIGEQNNFERFVRLNDSPNFESSNDAEDYLKSKMKHTCNSGCYDKFHPLSGDLVE
jgi:hypothetical protein